MAMTQADIRDVFKILGKLIYLNDLAAPQATAYRKTAMAVVDQGIDGEADEFEFHEDVAKPVTNNVKTVTGAINQIPNQAKTAAQQYLSRIIAPLAGLAVGTQVGTVLDSLISEMGTYGETVLENGKFYTYVDTNFSKQLPPATAGTETIDEAWVTNSVV